jgi:hypothetical protein
VGSVDYQSNALSVKETFLALLIITLTMPISWADRAQTDAGRTAFGEEQVYE